MAKNALLEALEEEALEQVKVIREYRLYSGQNPQYQHRAKVALGVVGKTVNLRATLANERMNELSEIRMLRALQGGGGVKTIGAGEGE